MHIAWLASVYVTICTSNFELLWYCEILVADIMLQEALAMRDAARENLRRQDCALLVFAFGYCTDNID